MSIQIQNNVLFRQSYNLQPNTLIKMSSINGFIHVHQSTNNQLTIEAEASYFKNYAHVDIIHTNTQFIFELRNDTTNNNNVNYNFVSYIGHCNNVPSPQFNMTIYIPFNLSFVQLMASNGNIKANNLKSLLFDFKTSNAKVILDQLEGQSKVGTSNGKIKAVNCKGEFILNTSNASIKVSGHSGSVYAKTSNGNIKFNNPNAREDGKTSNGTIKYTK